MGFPYQGNLDSAILAEQQAQTPILNSQLTALNAEVTALGSITDAAATTDTQNTGLIGLFKRFLVRLSLVVTSSSNLDSNLGTKADAVATTDTGTFSIIAFIKKISASLTTIATNTGATSDWVPPSTILPQQITLVANTANTVLTAIPSPKSSVVDIFNEGSAPIDIYFAVNTTGVKFKTLQPQNGWIEDWSGPVTVISTGTPVLRISRLTS